MGMEDMHWHALISELHYLLMRVTTLHREQNMLETGITNLPQRHTSVPRGPTPRVCFNLLSCVGKITILLFNKRHLEEFTLCKRIHTQLKFCESYKVRKRSLKKSLLMCFIHL